MPLTTLFKEMNYVNNGDPACP